MRTVSSGKPSPVTCVDIYGLAAYGEFEREDPRISTFHEFKGASTATRVTGSVYQYEPCKWRMKGACYK